MYKELGDNKTSNNLFVLISFSLVSLMLMNYNLSDSKSFFQENVKNEESVSTGLVKSKEKSLGPMVHQLP